MISKDIKALTGVRFFAALWVVLFHLRAKLELITIEKPFEWLHNRGYQGSSDVYHLAQFRFHEALVVL